MIDLGRGRSAFSLRAQADLFRRCVAPRLRVARRENKMGYPGFEDMLRRLVTADWPGDASFLLVDGDPSADAAKPGAGGFFEIWSEQLRSPLRPSDATDAGPAKSFLAPVLRDVKGALVHCRTDARRRSQAGIRRGGDGRLRSHWRERS